MMRLFGFFSFSYLRDRTAVRSVHVACRCPGQCQEWCRNRATESETQRFPRCVIRRLSAYTHKPHREGTSMGGLPLFNVAI